MLGWAAEEYLSMPILLIKMLMANKKRKMVYSGRKFILKKITGSIFYFFTLRKWEKRIRSSFGDRSSSKFHKKI